ncbi:MAG: DNA gyrase subunit A [Alphaproteobacteria bacterium]
MTQESNKIPANDTVLVSIEGEMKKSYLDYAMSVIVSRALPDCRDGFKPVHRRILYAMHDTNSYHDKPYKKSARVVGEVIGKYHPHGDRPIYMSLVRMAQEFSLREPLIDGQGNFGSIDGDSPAAMRYTEVRLAKIASTILMDIEQGTVDFAENYDGSEQEPVVLPARFPNILVNGTSGIAVGMATNIPTHNLSEVLDACCAYIKNPEITDEEIVSIIPAPDFPTGGTIVGAERAKIALLTGRGSIIMRGKTEIEQIGGTSAIIIKELPYQVNKAELIKKIEMLSKEKVIEGISELRDETNKLGIRVVIELKRDAVPDIIINQLYKHSELQTSFGVNMLALNKGRPILMGVKEFISAFVEFREEVIVRRTVFELNKARNRAHILIGLYLAVTNIDQIIALIKGCDTPAAAKIELMARDWEASSIEPLLRLVDDYRNKLENGRCKFTEEQADAILEMKLSRLTGLEKNKIENELKGLGELIKEYLEFLNSKEKIYQLIYDELVAIKDQFGTPRRTEILNDSSDLDIEDLIKREEMVVTTTMTGFIKRVPLDSYRAQKRGGKGRSAMTVYDDDMTTDIIVASTHAPLLFFSSLGKVYRMKVYKLPLASPQAKGKALINLLPLTQDEKITNIVPLPEDREEWKDLSIIFATKNGNIRRNDLEIFSNINVNGKIAIKLDETDRLIGVGICKKADHVLMCTKEGKAIRFPIDKLRIFKSRSSDGVRGMKFAHKDDCVVSMAIVSDAKADIEKRAEYLKIPENFRLEYRTGSDFEKLKQSIESSKVQLEKLSLEEASELAANEQFILSLTENGYGKRTSAYEYRVTGRGGQGIGNIDTSERNGKVIASIPVGDTDQIIVLTDGGTLIRTKVSDIRITGRNAMGVKIINTREAEKVISLTKIIEDDSEAVDESENVESEE